MVFTDHEYTHVPVGSLQGAEYNPRDIDAVTLQTLKESLRQFGFVQPVVVRRSDSLIIGGHQRVSAMLQIVAEDGGDPNEVTVPVVYLDNLDDEQAKMLNLALNKISGEWDHDKLGDLLSWLDEQNSELRTVSGFSDAEISDLLNFEPPAPPPPPPKKTKAQRQAQGTAAPPVEKEVFEFDVGAEDVETVDRALQAASRPGANAALVAIARDILGIDIDD